MTDFNKTFGERLRIEMERLNHSNVTLARAMGFASASTISQFCSGIRRVAVEHVFKLMTLGFDSNYLMTGERVKNGNNLNHEEKSLLENYRVSNDKDKNIAKAVLEKGNFKIQMMTATSLKNKKGNSQSIPRKKSGATLTTKKSLKP